MRTTSKAGAAFAALACLWAGCSRQEAAAPAMPAPPPAAYSFDWNLKSFVGREIRVTGFLAPRSERSSQGLFENRDGGRFILLVYGQIDPDRYAGRPVTVTGTVQEVPPPENPQAPFGMGVQGYGAGTLYVNVRSIEELPDIEN